MTVQIQKVSCLVKNSIPDENTTIKDEIDLDSLIPNVKSINYYERKAKDCPFARGNWILDLEFKKGGTLCFKFPLEMKKTAFVAYIQPVLDKFTKD